MIGVAVAAGALAACFVAYRIGYAKGVDQTAERYREHLRALDYDASRGTGSKPHR